MASADEYESARQDGLAETERFALAVQWHETVKNVPDAEAHPPNVRLPRRPTGGAAPLSGHDIPDRGFDVAATGVRLPASEDRG